MLDGKDFRAWHRGLPARSNVFAQASLALTLNQTPERIEVKAESRFATPAAGLDATLYLALLENRLSSKVTAGENAERTLHHDHVVRQLTGPLDPRRARHSFKLRPGWKAADLGVAAFVLDAQGATLQALARTGCPWFHPPVQSGRQKLATRCSLTTCPPSVALLWVKGNLSKALAGLAEAATKP